MLDRTFISQLSQINVSKSKEKTIDRVSEYWKGSSSSKKKMIIELGDTNSSSVYRVTRIGNVSAKIVLALAQICNINPYYFTGETDEPTKCTNTMVIKFLKEHGYNELAELASKLTKKQGKAVKDIYTDEDGMAEYEDDAIDTSENEEEKSSVTAESGDDSELNEFQEELVQEAITQEEAVDEPLCSRDLDIAASIVNLFCSMQGKMTDLQITTVQTLTMDDVDYLIKAMHIKAKAGGSVSTIYKIIKLLLIS